MPIAIESKKEIIIPDGVKVAIKDNEVVVTGPNGVLKRNFKHSKITVQSKKDKVLVVCKLPRKKENALLGTWAAHINNMVRGVTDGYEYKMKIVYSHFPIKTSVKDDTFIIENFLGERHPREAKILGDTEVKISGDQVIISGIYLENVSQSAANIEQATRIKRYDPRVFQDGIYLVEKRR